jgi:hypothetical protein
MHSHTHLRQLVCCLWKAHGHVPSAPPLQVRWRSGKHQAFLDCRHQRRRKCTASAGAPEVWCAQPIRSAEAPARECTSSCERWMRCLAQVSERVQATDAPVIVKTKQLMAGASDVLSLAQGAHTALQSTATCLTPGCSASPSWLLRKQCSLREPSKDMLDAPTGVVHWAPPAAALEAAAALVPDARVSAYGPCHGLPELVRLCGAPACTCPLVSLLVQKRSQLYPCSPLSRPLHAGERPTATHRDCRTAGRGRASPAPRCARRWPRCRPSWRRRTGCRGTRPW